MSAAYHKYTKNHYSEEQLAYWEECRKKSHEYAMAHMSETVKRYEVEGYFIICTQRKVDECMIKKGYKSEYGIQVWTCNPDEVSADEIFEKCIVSQWFDNPTEANEYFKQVKAMCY